VGTYREIPSRHLGKPNQWSFLPLTRAVFYQINQAGQLRRSSPLSVPRTHYADWVLHPLSPTTSKPQLIVQWQPAILVFLASGPSPYTLAFGRESVKSAAADLAEVAPGFSIQELARLELAQAGPLHHRVIAADREGAADAASAAANTRTLILWGVLLFGVTILGTMAWRLSKQMKS